MSTVSNHTESNRSESPPRSLFGRLVNATAIVLTTAIFVGLAGAGIAALQLRAANEPQPATVPPIRVATMLAKLEDGYSRVVKYTGRLEPARETPLAFERAGLVIAVEPEEGDEVAAGDVIARLDTSQLLASRRQLEARRDELKAQRDLADLTLGRQSKLQNRGWSPEQRLDEAKATVAQLAAAIDQVTAQIAAIEIDLEKSVLKAPYGGHIAARNIDDGAVVTPGTPVVTLLETGRRQARVGLPPNVSAELSDTATYILSAGREQLRAKLANRRRDLQTGTRTVTVLLDVEDGEDGVAMGQLVTLGIETNVELRGAWVPLTALKEGQRGMWTVLTIDRRGSQPVVRTEAVEVLHARGEDVYVRGTFQDGAEFLIDGTDRVVAGQSVALVQEQSR